MLDASGELYVMGSNMSDALSGHKSGHSLNNLLLRKLLAQADAWEYVTFDDPAGAPISYMRPVLVADF